MRNAQTETAEKTRFLFRIRAKVEPRPSVPSMTEALSKFNLEDLRRADTFCDDAIRATGHKVSLQSVRRFLKDAAALRVPVEDWECIQRDDRDLNARNKHIESHPWEALKSHVEWMLHAEEWSIGQDTARRFVIESCARLHDKGVQPEEIQTRVRSWLGALRSSARAGAKIIETVAETTHVVNKS